MVASATTSADSNYFFKFCFLNCTKSLSHPSSNRSHSVQSLLSNIEAVIQRRITHRSRQQQRSIHRSRHQRRTIEAVINDAPSEAVINDAHRKPSSTTHIKSHHQRHHIKSHHQRHHIKSRHQRRNQLYQSIISNPCPPSLATQQPTQHPQTHVTSAQQYQQATDFAFTAEFIDTATSAQHPQAQVTSTQQHPTDLAFTTHFTDTTNPSPTEKCTTALDTQSLDSTDYPPFQQCQRHSPSSSTTSPPAPFTFTRHNTQPQPQPQPQPTLTTSPTSNVNQPTSQSISSPPVLPTSCTPPRCSTRGNYNNKLPENSQQQNTDFNEDFSTIAFPLFSQLRQAACIEESHNIEDINLSAPL